MNLRPRLLLLPTLLLSTVFAACGGAAPDELEPGIPGSEQGADDVGQVLQEAHFGCRTNNDCSDGLFCTGVETCTVTTVWFNSYGTCWPGTPPSCNDGIACTADSCSDASNSCRHVPRDADGDGHAAATCRDSDDEPLGDDCDDGNSQRFPGNTEICNGVDEDCNPDTLGTTDADGDGYVSAACCNGSRCGDDCNDGRSDVHPFNVDPCDSVDNDCDGQIDENCQDVECAGEVALYPDNDGDGFGAAGSSPVNACTGAARLSPLANDCDDTNPAIKPGASSCTGSSVRTCGSNGQYITAACPGVLPRCLPQPNGTGICASL